MDEDAPTASPGPRWTVRDNSPFAYEPKGEVADSDLAWAWQLSRDDGKSQQTTFYVSDTVGTTHTIKDAAAQEAFDTRGLSVLRPLLADDEIPERFVIGTDGVTN